MGARWSTRPASGRRGPLRRLWRALVPVQPTGPDAPLVRALTHDLWGERERPQPTRITRL